MERDRPEGQYQHQRGDDTPESGYSPPDPGDSLFGSLPPDATVADLAELLHKSGALSRNQSGTDGQYRDAGSGYGHDRRVRDDEQADAPAGWQPSRISADRLTPPTPAWRRFAGGRRNLGYVPAFQTDTPDRAIGMAGRLIMRHKKLAAGSLAVLAMFGAKEVIGMFGPSHDESYAAAAWQQHDAPSVAAIQYINEAAANSDNEAVSASVADDQISVNIFADGIKQGDNVVLATLNGRKLPYALMDLISRGDPDAALSGTTGGLMPLPPDTAAAAAKQLGIDNYDPKDPVQNMRVGMHELNNLAARAYLHQMAEAQNPDPKKAEQNLLKEATRLYLDQIKLPSDASVVDELWQLVADQNTAASPTFQTLLTTNPAEKLALDNAARALATAYNNAEQTKTTSDDFDVPPSVRKALGLATNGE